MTISPSVAPAAFPLWWEPEIWAGERFYFTAQFTQLSPGAITGARAQLGPHIVTASLVGDYISIELTPAQSRDIRQGDTAKLWLETPGGELLWLTGIIQRGYRQ
ncbi:hypothetical protein QEH32_gp23 [Corynebacterium phage EmiRose]|uniref:Uncharacterized protein n=1 Tax=Corynebacterium phage EmiRose TaxID=2565372 RepID=A0A649VQ34_9CAUD|nr:hypothetical protein QEH32_gp23 [Corynebacterium phage EmiRose]QGJ94155.1 hypothetical protein SEA_EMIROSE_23 [Corynebacterium phage EmiRose]